MDLGVKDKVAMVTASSKGLGYGIARALGAEGAKLSMCSREASAIEAAAQKVAQETGAQTLAVSCDVSKPESILAWVDDTVGKWGQVDMLLVNAGGPPAAAFKDLTDAQWQAAFELTLMSTVRLIRAVIPHMKDGGAILTVTSSSIREPIERLGLSSVMRAGVAALVKTLADELAPDKIRVNNLMPGRIATDRVAQLDQGAANRQGISIEEVRRRSEQEIPLKRLGTIEEFGVAGAFLLSPAASYITGTSLLVDGGKMRSIT